MAAAPASRAPPWLVAIDRGAQTAVRHIGRGEARLRAYLARVPILPGDRARVLWAPDASVATLLDQLREIP
jgi:hypothetical protein